MIIYFTGTGNSRYAAQAVGEIVGDSLLDATEYIRRGENVQLESEKPWVFASPVYAWRLPRLFEKWLRNAQLSGSRKVYFLLTCGDDIGNAEHYLRRLCRDMDWEFCGVKDIRMPENYIALFDAPDEKTAAKIRRSAQRAIGKAAAAIGEERALTSPKVTFLGRLKSSVVNSYFCKFIISSRKFAVSDKCSGCGKCADLCPMRGIDMENSRPKWNGKCTHCMACICYCPVGAIEYGSASVGKVRYRCPDYAQEHCAAQAEE